MALVHRRGRNIIVDHDRVGVLLGIDFRQIHLLARNVTLLVTATNSQGVAEQRPVALLGSRDRRLEACPDEDRIIPVRRSSGT